MPLCICCVDVRETAKLIGHIDPVLTGFTILQSLIAGTCAAKVHISILKENLMHIYKICAEAVIVSAIIKLPFRILLNDCRFEKK